MTVWDQSVHVFEERIGLTDGVLDEGVWVMGEREAYSTVTVQGHCT